MPVSKPHVSENQDRHLARRRDEVVCATCGKRGARKSRQQKFCSERCREKARERSRKAFLGHDTGAPRHPPKKLNVFNPLQWAKSRSSTGIFGPRDVIEIEVTGRQWIEHVSRDGVRAFVAQLQPRALVARPA